MTTLARRRRVSGIGLNVVVYGLALVTLIPFAVVVSWSFKTQAEIFTVPISLVPKAPTLENYQNLFTGSGFDRFFPNSTFVAIGYTSLGVLWCAMGGWALAHYRSRLHSPLMILLIVVTALPFQVLIISVFLLVTRLGLSNSLWALIIPFSASPYGILFMRQYMLSLPTEVFEAARIDGAGEIRIFRSLVVPMSRPGLAALAIFLFLDSWNDFLWPLIAIQRTANFTVPIGMNTLIGLFKIEYGQIMAASLLSLLPVTVILLLMQRQFLAGLTSGAVRR
jgi:ABC-type glycerol-3-phosphate transport system permease component